MYFSHSQHFGNPWTSNCTVWCSTVDYRTIEKRANKSQSNTSLVQVTRVRSVDESTVLYCAMYKGVKQILEQAKWKSLVSVSYLEVCTNTDHTNTCENSNLLLGTVLPRYKPTPS